MNTVYLLIEREFIKTKEPIFKIGCSKQENDKRIKQYPKGSQLLLQIIVLDCVYIETKIKNMFKEKYIQRLDIGIEYFEGSPLCMRNDFFSIINTFDNLSNEDIKDKTYDRIINKNQEMINEKEEKIKQNDEKLKKKKK